MNVSQPKHLDPHSPFIFPCTSQYEQQAWGESIQLSIKGVVPMQTYLQYLHFTPTMT